MIKRIDPPFTSQDNFDIINAFVVTRGIYFCKQIKAKTKLPYWVFPNIFDNERNETMSKFNATKVTGPTGINHMGEKAYVMNDKEALTQLVLTTFLCNSYYATDTKIMNRINELVSKVGPEFSAK